MVDEPAPKKRGRPRKPEAEKVPREPKRLGGPTKYNEPMAMKLTVALPPSLAAAVNAEFASRLKSWREGEPVPTRGDVIRDALDAWFAR